ncbi:MAG: hypothetical protein AAGE85_14795 [Pseudomonadota bacterium]
MKNNNRLVSLDVLRGFTMLWIIGGDTFFHLFAALSDWWVVSVISKQLTHVPWEGLHAYDLVFPAFMFVSGMSLAYSFDAHERRGAARSGFLLKASRRALILMLLGIVYNFGWDVSADRFRVASVLGQIGVAYWAASWVAAWSSSIRLPLLALASVFALVAWLQLCFQVPGIGAGVMTPEGIANGWFDRQFLPGRLYGGSYDPEGILSTVSGISVTLMGLLAGRVLLDVGSDRQRRAVAGLAIPAVLLLAIGWALSTVYPVIKAAWSVPFTMLAGGYSLLLFMAFFWLCDVRKNAVLVALFVPIGMNAIGIYLAARFFVYPVFQQLGPGAAISNLPLAIAIVLLLLLTQWLVLRYFYLRGRFLSV